MYQRFTQISMCCTLGIMLFTVSACGQGTNSGLGAASGSPALTPTTTSTPSSSPGSATSVPTPGIATPPSGAIVTPVPTVSVMNGIEVRVGKAEYTARDAVSITISNNSVASIFVSTNPTSCSLVRVERQVNASWQVQRLCSPREGVAEVEIPVQSTKNIAIAICTSGKQPLAQTTLLSDGIYRVVFSYRLSRDPDTIGGDTSIYSQPFKVSCGNA